MISIFLFKFCNTIIQHNDYLYKESLHLLEQAYSLSKHDIYYYLDIVFQRATEPRLLVKEQNFKMQFWMTPGSEEDTDIKVYTYTFVPQKVHLKQ